MGTQLLALTHGGGPDYLGLEPRQGLRERFIRIVESVANGVKLANNRTHGREHLYAQKPRELRRIARQVSDP